MSAGDACENCGRKIGKLETPQLWQQHVVCTQCSVALSSRPPSIREIRKHQISSGLFFSIGWIPAAIIVGVLLFFGIKEYMAWRLSAAFDEARSSRMQLSLPSAPAPVAPAVRNFANQILCSITQQAVGGAYEVSVSNTAPRELKNVSILVSSPRYPKYQQRLFLKRIESHGDATLPLPDPHSNDGVGGTISPEFLEAKALEAYGAE